MAQKKNYEYEVDINGDISGLKQAMNSAVREFNSLERSLKNIQKAREVAPDDSKLLVKEQEMYASAIKKSAEALKDLKKQKKNIENDPNFKKGVTDETEQYTSLVRKIKEVTAEQKKLKQEMASLPNANQDKINRKFESFKDAVGDAVKEIQKYKDELSNIDKQIELDPTNLDLYSKKQETLNRLSETYADSMRDVNEAKSVFEKKSNEKFYKAHAQEISEVDLQIKQLGEDYKKAMEEMQSARSPIMSAFVAQFNQLSDSLGIIEQKSQAFSTACKGILTDSFNASKSYETSIAQIRKVADDLTDDVINDLKSIAVETGNSFENVAEYATISAALGLAGDEISTYTKALIDLNAVSGGAFSGEEGAKAVAVFLKQLNLGIDSAENFGSAIAVIGDKYADIGDETLNVATNLSGIATLVKTDQYQLLGLAGVMADLGLSSDTNANAINRAFLQIENVLSDTSKKGQGKLKALADTAGMTASEFKNAWGSNAVDAFLKFIDGLKSSVFNEINEAIDTSSEKIKEYADVLGWSADTFKDKWSDNSKLVFDQYVEKLGELDESSESASSVLKTLGISSVNTAQTLLRLAGSGNEVRSAIELATEAWEENSALQEKTNLLYGTTESKLQGFYESLRQFKASITDNVLPYVKLGIDALTELVKKLGEAPPTIKSLITAFLGIGSSLSPVTGYFRKLSRNISGFLDTLTGRNKELNNLKKSFSNLSSLFSVLGAKELSLLGVAGGVTAIATALAGLGYYVYQNNPLRLLKADLDEMVVSLEESTYQADLNYSAFDKQFQKTGEYSQAIDELTDSLKNNKLTEEEKQNIYEKINEYLAELNGALGGEQLYFDETTGKIMYQGEQIENVKDKFADLAFEAKKEAWLSAHQSNLEEAYKAIDDIISKESSATDTFNQKVQDIPQIYVDLFNKYSGDLDKIQSALFEYFNGAYDSGDFNAVKNAWNEYHDTLMACEEAGDNARQSIENYELVSQSTAETFNGIVTTINQQTAQIYEDSLNTQEAYEGIYEKASALAGGLGESKRDNNELLGVYEEQLQKLGGQLDYENEKAIKVFEEAGAWGGLFKTIGDGQALQKSTDEEIVSYLNSSLETLGGAIEKKTYALFNKETGTVPKYAKEGSVDIEHTYGSMWWRVGQKEEEDIIQGANNGAAYIESLNPKLNVGVNFTGLSGWGNVFSNAQQDIFAQNRGGSGGFGDFSGVFNSLRNSLSNIRSGGFGITVNANFNITNGSNINEATVSGWGLSIGEAINEYLGSQI